ncbi:histidine phosphatase family protein, partial [Streptomyces sp. IBSBF 2953]|nr:histidine phosphatase family protein [Streptomyces hayashii]
MKHTRLIRHGESAANAGEASLDHATIPLTTKGVEQASLVAGSFT